MTIISNLRTKKADLTTRASVRGLFCKYPYAPWITGVRELTFACDNYWNKL